MFPKLSTLKAYHGSTVHPPETNLVTVPKVTIGGANQSESLTASRWFGASMSTQSTKTSFVPAPEDNDVIVMTFAPTTNLFDGNTTDPEYVSYPLTLSVSMVTPLMRTLIL